MDGDIAPIGEILCISSNRYGAMTFLDRGCTAVGMYGARGGGASNATG